jgi:DNA-directed RNA polymerase subunit F
MERLLIIKNAIDRQIFDLWVEVFPGSAFIMGVKRAAGKIFIPSEENIGKVVKRIGDLKRRSNSMLQKKILDAIETEVNFEEPQAPLNQMLEALSFYLIKEGIRERHVLPMLENATKALSASLDRSSTKRWEGGVKILVLLRCLGLSKVLEVIGSKTKSRKLKARIAEFREKSLLKYWEAFNVPGFEEGKFSEVKKIIEENGGSLGRELFYPNALKHAFDYSENPEELEAKAVTWINEELPMLYKARDKLAKILGCSNSVEEIKKTLASRNVSPKTMLETTISVRKIFQKFFSKNIVEINPKYKTKVLETPSYLATVLPTAAAAFFDTLTKKPYQVYFITTKEERDPMVGFADLVSTLAHEEYGHCVHHSNSVLSYAAKPNILELLPTTHAGPISEGLSFQRELEFLDAMKELLRRKAKNEIERQVIALIQKYGKGNEEFLAELEYITRVGRITRFLRVVGDARINSGKQDLLTFLQWAHDKTGLPEEHVYYQIFPAHEGQFPGYATCYAVVGQELRSIQKRLKTRKQLVKFNSYASSMGFPPRSIYVERLNKYADKLASAS